VRSVTSRVWPLDSLIRMQAPGVRVRQAIPDEWERVRELRVRSLEDAPEAFGSTLEEERAFGRPEWVGWIDGWEGATNALYVAEAEDDERWVGMAVGSRTGEERRAHLYAMWVDPPWRTRGVGSLLVHEVIGWAASWGARSVVLGVTETNEGAVRFYERLGFADTGLRHPLREGSPLFVRILRREP
jgi:ribosomal protein S18 acetylase RimI-like enzyme